MQSPYGSNQLVGASKHTGTVGWRFEGPDAQQVQGAARVLVKQCIDQINFNGGWGQACRQLALRDGTIVKAIVLQHQRGWEPIVRVEVFVPSPRGRETVSLIAPWMESGLLYSPTFFSNVERFGAPNPPLGGYLVPLAAQRALNNEQWSYLDKITTHRDYSSPFLDSESLPAELGQDLNTRAVRSWFWCLSGKVRQLAQSKLAGFAHREYKDLPGESGGYFDSELTRFLLSRIFVSVEGFATRIPETVLDSTFLFTASFGVYYLVWIAGGIMYARKITVRQEYGGYLASFLGFIKYFGISAGSKEYQRLESYIFCVCDFSGDAFSLGSMGTVGSTIHYGWHASWDGHVIATVTHVSGSDGITSRLYVATLGLAANQDPDATPLTMTVSLREQQTWLPKSISDPAVWYPNTTTSGIGSVFWYPHACTATFSSDPHADDAPLYCFFDRSNVLRVVVVSITPDETLGTMDVTEALRAATATERGGGSSASASDEVSANLGLVEVAVVAYLQHSGQMLYSSAPQNLDSIRVGGGGRTRQAFVVSASVGPGSPCGQVVCVYDNQTIGLSAPVVNLPWDTRNLDCNSSGRFTAIQAQAHAVVLEGTDTVDDSEYNRVAVAIPAGDSDSVYLMNLHRTRSVGTVTYESGLGIHSNVDIKSGQVVGHTWDLLSTWKGGSGSNCDGTGTTQTVTPFDVRGYTLTQYLYDRHGLTELATYSESEYGNAGADLLASIHDLFRPPVCGAAPYPYQTRKFTVVSSLEGLKFYQSDIVQSQSAFVSNFEEPAWTSAEWGGSYFAGWQ